MSLSPLRPVLVLLAVLLAYLPAQARNLLDNANPRLPFEHTFNDEEAPWAEVQANLPGDPKPENLVRFEVSATAQNEHFIDINSISSDSDGVVRYALFIVSPSGAETVSYEGLRCENGDRKIYAFGRQSGEWVKNKRADWALIPIRATNNPHKILFHHYFCYVGTKRDVPELQRILRAGGIYPN